MRVGVIVGSELGSTKSNLEQHDRQDRIARVTRVTVAKALRHCPSASRQRQLLDISSWGSWPSIVLRFGVGARLCDGEDNDKASHESMERRIDYKFTTIEPPKRQPEIIT